MKIAKFYVIGMGSSPDLLTLRGVEAIGRSEICVVGQNSDLEAWKQHIADKPVIILPSSSRVFYGTDPSTLIDPEERSLAIERDAFRRAFIADVVSTLHAGKSVAYLQWGDPTLYGNLWPLEMLPAGTPSEIVPGVGAFQAASAALMRCAAYGFDTNSVILTTEDWPGRTDANSKLMCAQTSMVFFNMRNGYPTLFAQLAKAYPPDTPVAVVSNAGDSAKERIFRSTIGAFLQDMEWPDFPPDMHLLLVGKFLRTGQKRKDGAAHGRFSPELDSGRGPNAGPQH